MFCHVLSDFWTWLVDAARFFWRVPDISNTPRIISPLGRSHRIAFNLALSWKCSQPFIVPSISSIFFSARSIWFWLFFSCFVLFLCWLGGCSSYFFIRRVPDISYTRSIISSPVETPQNGIQHGSFLEWLQHVIVPSISSIFFSARSIWSWLFFSCFVLFLRWLGGCGSYFFIRSVPDISHTPRLISTLVEIPQSGIQHGSFLEVAPTCPNLSCFPLLFFSCFVLVLGWLGGCGSFFFIRRVPDISHCPRIISSPVEILQHGIQHGSFLEVATACPNLSLFPLFLPSSFQQEAFGRDCFFHVLSCFCAGWVVAAATFLFEGFQTSHIPLK